MLALSVLTPSSCDGCGLCCEGIGSPVLLYASRPGFGEPHPYRPDGLPQELIEEIDLHFSGLMRGQEPQDHFGTHPGQNGMPAPPEKIILSGHGDFLAINALRVANVQAKTLSLREELGATLSRVGPAHALAVLAREAASV